MQPRTLPNTKTIRRAALHLLARRDHSATELLSKLKTKGFATSDIELVITALRQEHLLNEDRYTENYIHARRQKGYGPERIMRELHSRGLPDEMIAKHLDIKDNAWFIEANKVWRKHFKGQSPRDFKDQARQMRFLQYRGYTLDQINHLFKDNIAIDTYDI